MTPAPTRIATLLLCVTASLTAVAGEATSPKRARPDRSAKILRSLDGLREQLGKAKEQIERLESEIQGLREELAGLEDGQDPRPGPAQAERSAAGLRSKTKDGAGKETPKVFPVRDPNFGENEDRGGGEVSPVEGLPQLPAIAPAPGVGSEYLLVVPPEGDRVVAFETRRRRSIPFILSNDKTVRHSVTPVVANSLVGLAVEGPRISRLAVFANRFPGSMPTWYPVELREPVDSAVPEVEPFSYVLYTLGRRVYAYSQQAQRWDVLELPEGVEPRRGDPNSAGPTFVHDGHIYTFETATGKWSDLDTRAILDSAPEKK